MLALEAFKGTVSIQEKSFYKYSIVNKGEIKNAYQFIGKIKYRLSASNQYKPVFTDNNYLYTLHEMNTQVNLEQAEVKYEGNIILPIKENKHIYEEMIVYYINQHLRYVKWNDMKKYEVKNNAEILSPFFLIGDNTYQKLENDKGIQLKRKFTIEPCIDDKENVILYCKCAADFATSQSVMDLMKAQEDIIGLQVKYEWTNIKGVGVIEEISEKSISEKQKFGQSLIEYFEGLHQGSRFKNFTDEDRNAKCIRVKLGKSIGEYIPHALRPIITREYILKNDDAFSKKIETEIKLNMTKRAQILKQFIQDIGVIHELNGLSFLKEYMLVSEVPHYKEGLLEKPNLIGASGTIKYKAQIFKNGFYKIPPNKKAFGVIFPTGYEDVARKAIRAIYDFCRAGKYAGQENAYIKENLLDVYFRNMTCIWESYVLGDITEYKRVAKKLKDNKNTDFVIAIIPDQLGANEEENPYNPFKREWAKYKIPSQMISLSSARILGENTNAGIYYLHNIVLGILGKLGGVPWIIKEMPGNIDCFIGLDVGTREKGIHYPACSVVFDKYGKLINYYKPTIAQSGEIIATKVLQEVFDEVLLSYQEEYGRYPQNIMIHRDGFAREDLEWYKQYFSQKNINFNILEVRKSGGIKLANINNNKIENPVQGSYIVAKDLAHIVTTDIKVGSPRTLKIEKLYGDCEFMTAIKQVYYLTQLHVGSTKSTRLPITTDYADKICKAIEFIPAGEVSNQLFFL